MGYPYTEKKTGRTRHRVSGIFKKKLVLQVEIFVQYMDPHDFHWSPGATTWRDAKPEDMTESGSVNLSH